jgi:hypothetical protein
MKNAKPTEEIQIHYWPDSESHIHFASRGCFCQPQEVEEIWWHRDKIDRLVSRLGECEICGCIYTIAEMKELDWYDGLRCNEPDEDWTEHDDVRCGGIVNRKEETA